MMHELPHLAPWSAVLPDGLNGYLGASVAHEPGLLRQQVVPEEGPQNWVDLLLGQVPGRAEDHERVGGVVREVSLFLDVAKGFTEKLEALGVATL